MNIARTGPALLESPSLESPPRKSRRATFSALLVAALLLVSTGCGPQQAGDENRTTVSGTVTFNGKPLPAGTITFQSIDKGIGTPTSIREGGRYATDRAPIGENAVIIETDSIQYGNPAAYVPIPAKYADPTKSDLRVDVKPGENKGVDFALTQ